MSTKLEALKTEATDLGLEFHPSIGEDKLAAKIEEHHEAQSNKPVLTPVWQPKETESERHERIRKECNKLVRVNITCMNPAKSEYDGEVFTASNSIAGTIKKFVPFNRDDGFHVPQLILNVIQERKFQVFKSKKGKIGGTTQEKRIVKEFAIEYLEPLTEAEYKELGRKQELARSAESE